MCRGYSLRQWVGSRHEVRELVKHEHRQPQAHNFSGVDRNVQALGSSSLFHCSKSRMMIVRFNLIMPGLVGSELI